MLSPQVLTLLTDFGLRDGYGGVMQGAIAQINPHIRVIDLTHQIPPQNLWAARFVLMNTYAYFPAGTVHVAVVDPGVGSQRRGIAVQIQEGFLVGPDNGIFSGILSQSPAIAAVELTNPHYWRVADPSTTFHGRDIFAPVGAHLASGVSLWDLGKAIAPETLTALPLPPYTRTGQRIEGRIQHIDHFGNLITNIPGAAVSGAGWVMKVGDRQIPVCQTYSDRDPGDLVALVGSHGWVELAINQGNAQAQVALTWGDGVTLEAR